MSIPDTRLLALSAPVTFRPEDRGPHGQPYSSAWVYLAEELRQRVTLLSTRRLVILHATSTSVQVLTLAGGTPLRGHFAFTYLGETRWQARTTFVGDQTEIATEEESGAFMSRDATMPGPIPRELLEAALDWATDEAISNFIRLNP